MQKNIPDPGFADDDGSADPAVAAALAAYDRDRSAEPQLLSALAGARVLVPVVAVLGDVETGPDGLRREKSSDMAVPTLQAPDGRRALPAFTSMETLRRWRADARPVAVPLPQALLAASHEKADTVVVDLAGPVTYQLTGPALRALAEGRTSTDPLADPAVTEALRTLLDAEPGVLVARLAPSDETDATLALGLAPDAPTAEVAQRLARALATDEVLRARLVRGLDLALLPPGGRTAEEPFYRR
ncbi:SseB family protein [Streptomyces sp. Je 1-4]|uniref:SseB family protein n=1 Tax=Streptomyces TaxID=1883 RepID=UPI0021DA3669|nr:MULTISPECIES: SseB family protein [unclassified Streptomyces]UYB43386.1 SseB family protein [Streptomyces sp. Je 1-4]UZQ39763.1 SseB family protein [Streptomyces sp. Je 1-4] [Streptomyces sp. Je 1-4 4N24]UZQ47180.1 SseB family protein [Streptomyces sp. Je 1-4] [Streptomyces sp. Je 1-4 4N24_ara]